MKPTGNGRRESYANRPMPPMTNTHRLAGDKQPAEVIASVQNGIYADALRLAAELLPPPDPKPA